MFFIIVSCAGTKKNSCTADRSSLSIKPLIMPGWFWESPSQPGVHFAVGYSRPYDDLQSSYDDAYMDAAWRLYSDKGCRVKGERAQAKAAGGVMSLGNSLKFEVDSTGFEFFAAHIVRIDSFASEDAVVMLLGTRGAVVNSSLSLSPVVHHPADLANNGKYIVGTGTAPAYFYNHSSWLEAERSARIEAAFAINTQVRSSDYLQDQYMEKTLVLGTDAFLKIHKTYRTFDPQTGHCWVYVLVSFK